MKKKILFALVMGIITTGIISCSLLVINTPLKGMDFIKSWAKSWMLAYMIVIPCILILSPLVERLINNITKNKNFNNENNQ